MCALSKTVGQLFLFTFGVPVWLLLQPDYLPLQVGNWYHNVWRQEAVITSSRKTLQFPFLMLMLSVRPSSRIANIMVPSVSHTSNILENMILAFIFPGCLHITCGHPWVWASLRSVCSFAFSAILSYLCKDSEAVGHVTSTGCGPKAFSGLYPVPEILTPKSVDT